jgi:hypothetical protein
MRVNAPASSRDFSRNAALHSAWQKKSFFAALSILYNKGEVTGGTLPFTGRALIEL